MRDHFEFWCEELGVPESDPEQVIGVPGFEERPASHMVYLWVEQTDMGCGYRLPELRSPVAVFVRCPDDYVCRFFASGRRTVSYSVEGKGEAVVNW